jgi:23S rRNA (guanosine2251-2'-O)-methyltransferase
MAARFHKRHRSRSARGADVHLTVAGPHAVLAALEQPDSVERVFLENDAQVSRADVIRAAAGRAGIPVSATARGECDRLAGVKAQGVAASIRFRYADFDDLISAASGMLVFLDGIEDPQNLGAIIRTAEAAGCLGVVIPARRTAEVTPAVVRASAGTALQLPIARPVNLAGALHKARDAGFWALGLDHQAERVIEPQRADTRSALVVGGEGRGLGRLVRETCDELVRIPMRGRVESLNASAATAVAIYRMQSPTLFPSDRVDTHKPR